MIKKILISKNSLINKKLNQYQKKKINSLLDNFCLSKYFDILNKNNYKKI